MIPQPHRLAVILLLVLSLASVRAAETGPLAPVLQRAVEKHLVAGVVALVADKEKVLDLEAAGFSSLSAKTPIQTDALFWIASMTKSMTSTALMMLVDEGKVNLDDPVEKYLPEFQGQMVAEDKDHPHPPQHPITVREIMDHTSGLVLASDHALKHLYTLKDNVAQYAAMPLHREPGTRYEYNNCGINTGARIIEVVTGTSYADFMQQRLFTPLEMKETTYWPTEEQAAGLATTAKATADKSNLEDVALGKDLTPQAIQKFSGGVPVPAPLLVNFGMGPLFDYANHYTEPAGGLYSTASDVGRLCQMLLNGGVWHGRRYLSEDAVRRMTSNQTGDVPVNPDEGYGVGWSVKKKDNEGPSVGSFGHRGARRTAMWVDPTNQIVMVVMIQRWDMTGEEQKEFYGSVFRAMVDKFGRKP